VERILEMQSALTTEDYEKAEQDEKNGVRLERVWRVYKTVESWSDEEGVLIDDDILYSSDSDSEYSSIDYPHSV
jgi:hypothetical protein